MDHLIIKKYGNRRLYNTHTRAYTSIQQLAVAAQMGIDFTVFDSEGNDITQQILIQIITDLAGKTPLISTSLLRQLICLTGSYGRSMVPHLVAEWTTLMNAMRRQPSASVSVAE